jgi:cell division protein FtsB
MFIAAIFILIMGVQIHGMKQEDDELAKKEQKLQEAYASEQDRTTELEEQELFVQTKQYIEEAAKKLGFVYPDEIIFKPSK